MLSKHKDIPRPSKSAGDLPGDFPDELISIDDVYLSTVDGIWLFGPENYDIKP